MRTPTTCRQHNRANLRYDTDLTDAEWAVIAPLMPEPASRGRPPLWTKREILNAVFYVLRGDISLRLIPKDLPPRSTMFGEFSRWRAEGLFGRINHTLVMADRERAGCEASPRRSRAASVRLWSTRTGEPSCSIRKPPTSRITTEPDGCCACRGELSRSSSRPSPMSAMPATDPRPPRASPSRSCASPRIRSALPFIRVDGWWNATSPGSAAIGASGRTQRPPSPPPQAFLYAAAVLILVRRLGASSMTYTNW